MQLANISSFDNNPLVSFNCFCNEVSPFTLMSKCSHGFVICSVFAILSITAGLTQIDITNVLGFQKYNH